MLIFTLAQQSETIWVRLLTVAALPAPSLALFLGTVALIVTNSRKSHELRNEVVEEFISNLMNESCAEREAQRVGGGRN